MKPDSRPGSSRVGFTHIADRKGLGSENTAEKAGGGGSTPSLATKHTANQ